MKVWILQTGEPLHCDAGVPRPMRAMNLANALLERGHEVVIWSSGFNHQNKAHRCTEFASVSPMSGLTINLIPSRGYEKHIGTDRLIDHAQLAFALSKRLGSSLDVLPDVAFVGFPPIESAIVMIEWLRKNKIPVFLDVKDLWPGIFIEALPTAFRPIAPLLLSPYFFMAKRAIRKATALSSISQPFLREVLKHAMRTTNSFDRVFPLVPGPKLTDAYDRVPVAEWWQERGVDLSHSRRLCFVGALSRAYDFWPVSDAVRTLLSNGVELELVICGGGQELSIVKQQFQGLRNVKFPGWVDLPKIDLLMQASVGTVAPYRSTRDFKMSIPNKVIDSLSFGLPVITSLDGETRSVLERENVGIYCGTDTSAWQKALMSVLRDQQLQSVMSENCKRLFKENFSFEKVYGEFVNILEQLALSKQPIPKEFT